MSCRKYPLHKLFAVCTNQAMYMYIKNPIGCVYNRLSLRMENGIKIDSKKTDV